MTDVFEPSKRSQVMSGIRGQGNRSTELAMVELLRGARITGWRRHIEMRPRLTEEDRELAIKQKFGRVLTRPDFVFRPRKLALFVDGCFWHGCPLHSTAPAQNAEFWSTKLAGNVRRDGLQTRALEAAGWKVFRVWEHELRDRKTLTSRLLRGCGRQVVRIGNRGLKPG